MHGLVEEMYVERLKKEYKGMSDEEFLENYKRRMRQQARELFDDTYVPNSEED